MKSSYNLFILIIFFLSVFFGCNKGNKSYNPKLLEIDSLLNVNPERAYELISKVDTNGIEDRNNRQFYNLLFAESRYKNYYDDTIDAGISEAARYFLKSGDKRKAARAYFQDGQIKMNQENYGGALISMHEALENLDSVNDPFIYGRINSEISRVYFKLHAAPMAVEHELKAYNNYLKCDSLIFIMETEDALAKALNNAGSTKEGKGIALRLLKRAEKDSDTLMIQKALIDLSLSALWEKDDEEAIKYYEQAYQLDSVNFPEHDRELFLDALLRGKRPVNVINMYKEKLWNGNNEINNFNLYEYEGNYREAFNSLKGYYRDLNKTYDKILKGRYLKEIETYREEKINKEKARAALQTLKLWIVILMGIIFILIILFILYISNHRKNKKIAKLTSAILLLKNESEEVKRELEKERNHTETKDKVEGNTNFYSPVLLDFFNKIGNIYSQIYRTKNSESARKILIKNFEQELNSLKENENFISELEKWINLQNKNILELIFKHMGKVSHEQRMLIDLLYFKLNTETICMLLEIEPNTYYVRKNRLIRRLSNSESAEIREFADKLK